MDALQCIRKIIGTQISDKHQIQAIHLVFAGIHSPADVWSAAERLDKEGPRQPPPKTPGEIDFGKLWDELNDAQVAGHDAGLVS